MKFASLPTVLAVVLTLHSAPVMAANSVRSTDIVDGQVMTVDLANNAVTSAKIADGQVTTNDLADGAVTDAKISGSISSSKISKAGLDADTLDGIDSTGFAAASHVHAQTDVIGLDAALAGKASSTHDHDMVYQKKLARVIVVSPDGNGDYLSPLAAVNDIGDNSPTNPYVVRMMPGVYDLGSASLRLKAYVDLEGAGTGATWIKGAYTGPEGLLVAWANVSVSRLSIVNDSPGSVGDTVFIDGGAPVLSSVDIYVQGGSTFTGAAVRNLGSVARFEDVSIDATGAVSGAVLGIQEDSAASRYEHVRVKVPTGRGLQSGSSTSRFVDCSFEGALGVYGQYSNFTLESVDVAASSGLYLLGGEVVLRNVTAAAVTGNAIEAYGSGVVNIALSNIKSQSAAAVIGSNTQFNIALSQLAGPLIPGPSYACFQNYSESMTPINCP